MESKKTKSPISQILTAVVIALLVGGSSPWWFNEFFSDNKDKVVDSVTDPKKELSANDLKDVLAVFEEIEYYYNKLKGANSCQEVRHLVERIRVYKNDTRRIPESYDFTIRNPSQIKDPQISDLVTDRISRIQSAKEVCFRSSQKLFFKIQTCSILMQRLKSNCEL